MVTYSVQASHGDYWHDSVVMSDNCHMCSCGSFDNAKFIASRLNAHDDLVAALERAQKLARLVTVRQVIEAGDDAIDAAGLNPWAINEGLAEGNEPIGAHFIDAALTLACSSQVEQR
jgi:hypothetical protein